MPKGTRTIVREGFVVGLPNPKAAIIFTVVLPQFTDPARGHVPLQLLALGGIFLAIGVVSDSAWAIAAIGGLVLVRLGRAAGRHRPPRLTQWQAALPESSVFPAVEMKFQS